MPPSAAPTSINGLIRHRVATSPDTPIVGVPDKQLEFERYTFRELDAAASLLASFYASPAGGSVPVRAPGDKTTKLQAALLAPSGFDFIITQLALLRMGYCVLFVSVNNSPAAVAHLLAKIEATVFIVAPRYAAIGRDAIPLARADGQETRLIPTADELVYDGPARAGAIEAGLAWPYALDQDDEVELDCFIVHSSGSTGFPKPIVMTHQRALANYVVNFDLQGFTTLPLYHNFGHSCLWRAICSVKILYIFPASTLPLTIKNVLGLLSQPVCKEVRGIFGVPFVYKLLSEDEEGIALLRQYDLCLYGGSVMPDEVGDRLVENGVKLVGHIGSTEMGQLMTTFREFETDKAWNYFRTTGPLAVKNIEHFIDFEYRDGEGKHARYECIVKKGWPSMTMSNRPNGDYATSDAYRLHPTIPHAYKFIGRLDDTLVMVNGEKTNPVPIEVALRSFPTIADAIVFGAGRSQAGALIILSEFVPKDTPREALLTLVKPAVDFANADAPSHSQLSAEMLVFLPFETVIPRADKGSFLRPKVYVALEDVIDGVYAALDGEGGEKHALASLAEAEAVVAAVVKSTVEGSHDTLKPSTDLFDYGLDSLQAGRIRNSLQRSIDLRGAKLGTNFVFDRPSISKMAAYLYSLSSGSALSQEASVEEEMARMVDKYRHLGVAGAVTKPSSSGSPSLEAVVLTGATGSLGASLLAELLPRPDVRLVFCLCRAKDDADALARVAASMQARGLPTDFGGKVVALASDLGADRLGLAADTYAAMAKQVTMVVHNAWSVNFNQQIASFETHIRGAVNLMKLALAPATVGGFYFTSSVSSVARWRGPDNVPESVTADPTVAQGMGYAQSKWVTEKLCEIVSAETALHAGVLRVGQMVGDTANGVWNETEAISLMIKSADVLHALPALADSPSWLPVDYAAKTIVDVALRPASSATACPCWHVLNPRTISWVDDVLPALKAAGLRFDIVSPAKWVDLLDKSAEGPGNPTRKLLQFFQDKYTPADPTLTAAKRYALETRLTAAASPSLAGTPVVDDALMAKFVGHWRQTKFLA